MRTQHVIGAALLVAMLLGTGSCRRGPPPPSCAGMPDGLNAYPGREWSPYFLVCRSQKLQLTGFCPGDPTLKITRLFDAEIRHCVTPYEIPRSHSSISLSCEGKVDGLHLDDVTSRPDVYYRCFGGKMVKVYRCKDGQFFDEASVTCTAKPMYNSILIHKPPENV